MEQNLMVSRSEMWSERLAELSASGMTQKEWCKVHQIPMTTLRYWKRKLQAHEERPERMAWLTAGSLDPVQLQDSGLTIQKPGITIQLSSEADPEICLDLLHLLLRS